MRDSDTFDWPWLIGRMGVRIATKILSCVRDALSAYDYFVRASYEEVEEFPSSKMFAVQLDYFTRSRKILNDEMSSRAKIYLMRY